MLNLEYVKNKLEASGLPVAYRVFPKDRCPMLPFAVYYSTGATNYPADGDNYYRIDGLIVELYTKDKDIESESKIENQLDFAIWDKVENYLDTEKCYQIVYTMEV